MSVKWLSLFSLGAVAALTACNAPGSKPFSRLREGDFNKARRVSRDPDIIRVVTYWVNNPFVSFDEQVDPNPEGVKLVYYAVSGKTREGAYGDGMVRFKMYVIHQHADQPPSGELVKTWEFDPDQALGYRVARRSRLGWPYQFYLNWGQDLDVYGKEVRFVPEFVRHDGRVIRGSPKDIRIPMRKQTPRLLDQT